MADGTGGSGGQGPATDASNDPVIDPTRNVLDLVKAAIERQDDLRALTSKADREYLDAQLDVLRERFRGMDEATRVLNETVHRVPTEMQQAVGNLRDVVEEKFKAIENQFKERDTRSERESRDNKVAVDAAFAAQKEAASEQNKSNTLAIDKSEKATAETLAKQADLFESRTRALDDKIGDLKGRVDRAEAGVAGGHEQREETRASDAAKYLPISVAIALVGLMLAIALYLGQSPPT